MDKEHTSRTALCRKEAECQDPVEKARLAFLIGQCDEKVQAITVLMLHFCAGLQHTQDQEDQQQVREELRCFAKDILLKVVCLLLLLRNSLAAFLVLA